MDKDNTGEKSKKVIIDVDVIIKKWNTANPDKKQLDRKSLSELMKDNGLDTHTQTFSDWKRGKAHQMIAKIEFLKDLGGCDDFGEFITSIEADAK